MTVKISPNKGGVNPEPSQITKRPAPPAATKPAATSDGEPRPNDNAIASNQLKSVVERVERLEEEKKAIANDIRDVYAEAKANGFDVKVLRQVVKLRQQDSTQREEYYAVLNLYLTALGLPTL